MSIWNTVMAHKEQFLRAFSWQFIIVPAPLITGWISQEILDNVVGRDAQFLWLWLAILLAILSVAVETMGRAWYMAQYDLLAGVVERFRLNAFRSAVHNNDQSVATLAERVANDPDPIGLYPTEFYKSVLQIFFGIIAILILFNNSIWITITTLVPALAFVLIIRQLQKFEIALLNDVASKEAEVATHLEEVVRNAPPILRHGGQSQAVARYSALRSSLKTLQVSVAFWHGLIDTSRESLGGITTALVLLASADKIASGELTVGQFALFTIYSSWVVFIPMRVTQLMGAKASNVAARNRLIEKVGPRSAGYQYIDLQELPQEAVPRLSGTVDVTIKDIPGHSFGDVIKFTIRPGTITLVQGSVGSGKTSVLQALFGLGHAKATLKYDTKYFDSLGTLGGFASATPEFVDANVANNIELARAGNWEWAVTLAMLKGDPGVKPDSSLKNNAGLSGGQRARLAVARALFDNPAVVVLDDPTAALDEVTIQQFWRQLRESGVTAVVASNHPDAERIADLIITL